MNYIILSDGRRLVYEDSGEKSGIPIFYFHGTPGSRLETKIADSTARKLNFRLISIDRPGIGGSDYNKHVSIRSNIHDLIALSKSLNIKKFGIIGVSGGATTLLSCTRFIPRKLLFAIDIAGWAPFSIPELKKEIAPLDRFFGMIAVKIPSFFRFPFSIFNFSSKYLSSEAFLTLVGSSMGDSDKIITQNQSLLNFFMLDLKEAFKQGTKEPALDAILCYKEWGFNLSEIQYPLEIFHGTADKFAPFKFALYKKKHIKETILHTYDNIGHLGMIFKLGEILHHVKEFYEL